MSSTESPNQVSKYGTIGKEKNNLLMDEMKWTLRICVLVVLSFGDQYQSRDLLKSVSGFVLKSPSNGLVGKIQYNSKAHPSQKEHFLYPKRVNIESASHGNHEREQHHVNHGNHEHR